MSFNADKSQLLATKLSDRILSLFTEKRKLKRENQYLPDEADTLFERTRLRRKNVLRSLKSFPLSSMVVFP